MKYDNTFLVLKRSQCTIIVNPYVQRTSAQRFIQGMPFCDISVVGGQIKRYENYLRIIPN